MLLSAVLSYAEKKLASPQPRLQQEGAWWWSEREDVAFEGEQKGLNAPWDWDSGRQVLVCSQERECVSR